jgi:hypothetical protein
METTVAINALPDRLPDLLLNPAAPYPSINGMLGDAVQREDRVGGLLGDETRKPG